MIQDIINRYQTSCSIESISKEFKIGKVKIKKILSDNNVPLKKRGGQTKHDKVPRLDLSNHILSCKICEKQFNDVDNKSGCITDHLSKCYPDIEIPTPFKRRMYLNDHGKPWHLEFFNLSPKQQIDKVKCMECGWDTLDTTNKTGSLTKHIECNHGSISDYVEKYPTEIKYFSFLSKSIDRNTLFEDLDNYVTCKICDEPFKTITNTHLELHNTDVNSYRCKFGDESLVSVNMKTMFVENLSNCVINQTYRSKSEIEIEEFIKSLNVHVIVCDKKQLNGVELDLYLPDYKIAIEYNGLYWHSEKRGKHQNYHLDKTEKCLSKGIRLIHIFSDEWLTKKEIIKSRLINILKLDKDKIYARNCEIIELDKKTKSTFLNQNHLQGNDKSSIYYGLSYNKVIVSVITFGKLRKVLGNKTTNDDEYELYRYCSRNVIGGFSKLLKHFIKTHNPKKIITYANRNWSPSDDFCFYSNNGFNLVGVTKPNYSYTKRYDFREHRFNYRKDKLIKLGYNKSKTEEQIMFELGYDRIWDTGNIKYQILL